MSETYRKIIDEFKEQGDYWAEITISDFTEDLCRAMEEQGINRSQLAKRLGTSTAYVTKVLRGNANFTMTTMTKLAQALGLVVRVHLAPSGTMVHWRDEYNFESGLSAEQFQVPQNGMSPKSIRVKRGKEGSASFYDIGHVS